jgi:Concanavalin A-like lectin/glucanases superfamily
MVALSARASAASAGPMAAYSFDEGEGTTVEDLTGDGHTATIHGAKWTTHGRYGDALEFDGADEDYVSVPASEELDQTEEFTVEAWVRPTEAPESATILMKERGGGPPHYSWTLGQHGERSRGSLMEDEGPEGEEGSLPSHVWTHLALTDDGAHARLYVDGELVDTGPAIPVEGDGEIRLGGDGIGGDWFTGRIDEVRIYDCSLSGAEVVADMEAPLQTPKKGPVAAYSFDEGEGTTVEDVTGDGHTVTIHGAERTPEGRYGDAMEFDAEDGDYLSVPDSPELDFTEEFTLEAWVRPDNGDNDWSPLIDKQIPGDEGLSEYAYYLYEGDYEEDRPHGGVLEGEYLHAGSRLPSDAWSHVALTYDGATLRLYVDGELVDQGSGGPPPVSEGNLEIGGATEQGSYLNGRIDEVRIYDRALDGAEVVGDMEAPLQTPRQGPVAAWSFDQGEGTTVEDLTGDGHTATIEGAQWTTHGRYGDALEFDGEEDCLSVAPASDLQLTEEFTIEAWVRPGASTEAGALFAKENSVSPRYGYLLEDEGEHLSAYFDESAESGHLASAEGSLPLHAWTHLALTDDGAHTRLYIDGELAGSIAAVPIAETDGDLRIGCDKIWNEYFDGRIDEVQIYERALSGTEVAADTEAPLQTPQQGPVAAYSFDQGEGTTVEDVTGDGNTATIEGAQWTTHGRYGDAVEFDGEQCVSVPNSEALQLTEAFTVEAWVKLQGLPTDDPIFFKETEADYSYAMDVGFGNEGDPAGFLGGEELVGPSSIESNVWTHIAFTYDGSETRLFVDGEQVASEQVGPLATDSEGPLYIGCDGPAWGDHFRGRIDEVRIYERALDEDEVDTDMESPIQTTQQGPVAYYSFDEGEGTTVEDLTGDGHTATIHGAKWTTHGRYGDALEFDGADEDYVSVPASEELDQTEEFTVEAWVRPTEATSLATILMKERSGGEPHYSWALKQHAERPRGYLMEEEGPEGEEGSLPLRVWTHLALTDDGAHTRLYVNGELVDTGPAIPVEGDGEIRLGGDGIWGDWFTGRIDEVGIYNRALDDSEVVNDMGPHDLMSVATVEDEGTLTRAVGKITYSTTGDQQQRSIPHVSLAVSSLGPIPDQAAAATRLSSNLREVEGRKYVYKYCPYYEGGTEASHNKPGPEGGLKELGKFTEGAANEGEVKRGCPPIGALGGEVEYTIEVLGTIRYDSGVIVEAEEGPTCVERGNPKHEEAEEKLRAEIKEEPTKGKELKLEELEVKDAKPELAKEGCFAKPPGGGTKGTNGIDMIGRWHWKPAGNCDCLNTVFQQPQNEPQACGELDGHIPVHPPKLKVEETITERRTKVHLYFFESSPTSKKIQGCYWNDKTDQRGYRESEYG